MVGNHILADGQDFTPYGVTVFGLSTPNWQSNITSDLADIRATATYWHGNAVRIQVAPSNLFDQQPYDAAYLSAMESEVDAAQASHLTVILSAQYERTGDIPLPNTSTLNFWQFVAPIYAHDPGIWFDLFNEPHLGGSNAPDTTALWSTWRNGGSGYVGMQQLVDAVRVSAPNIVLAEGLDTAKSLAGLPAAALTGNNIAYAVHPYFSGPQWSTPAAWDQNWGDLTGQYPIVADEWGEYESSRPSCHPDASSLVPEFLSYLTAHDVGLIAWSFSPGVLVVGTNLDQPTSFVPGVRFVCGSGVAATSNGEGSGADIMAYFASNSQPAS